MSAFALLEVAAVVLIASAIGGAFGSALAARAALKKFMGGFGK